ncbi:hypothetical protein ACRC7T_14070 [Segnochrobactraceae bacterium EtOH-i3]
MLLHPAQRLILGIGVAASLTCAAIVASAQPADAPMPRPKPPIIKIAGR